MRVSLATFATFVDYLMLGFTTWCGRTQVREFGTHLTVAAATFCPEFCSLVFTRSSGWNNMVLKVPENEPAKNALNTGWYCGEMQTGLKPLCERNLR